MCRHFRILLLAAAVAAAPLTLPGGLASLADATPETLPEPSAETSRLFERWAAASRKLSNREQDDHPLYKQLMAEPDADLCFLKGARSNGDLPTFYSTKALGRLNTPRTFAAVVAELKHPDMFRREWAVSVLRQFPAPQAVPLLAERLGEDPSEQVRLRAAGAIGAAAANSPLDEHARSVLRRALLHPNIQIAVTAAYPLAKAGDPRALEEVERRIAEVHADRYGYENAIHVAGARRSKAGVEFLLRELARLSEEKDPAHSFVTTLVAAKLLDHYRPIVDRFRPNTDPAPHPETLEQWQDWWKKTSPTLNDDLSPKQPAIDPKTYADADFVVQPEKATLSAAVDAEEYRVGDPIRLMLRMRNGSDHPQRLFLPFVPSGWYPTMAYGVSLMRDGRPVTEFDPSDFYVGSYGGPPGRHALAPGETFEDSVCLQYWLPHQLDLPLPEGRMK